MTTPQRLTAIAAMSSVQKKAEWHRCNGTPAPPAFGSGLLARALAHELQVKALGGGLTKSVLRRMAQLSRKDERVRDGAASGTAIPGRRGYRVWDQVYDHRRPAQSR